VGTALTFILATIYNFMPSFTLAIIEGKVVLMFELVLAESKVIRKNILGIVLKDVLNPKNFPAL